MLNNLSYISFSEITEYWNLFNSYVDLSTVLIWGLLGGLLGFAIMLILEIVFRKKILVKREYKILKYLAYLYFAFLPFWGSFCFSQWFALYAVEKEIAGNISTIMNGSDEIFNKYLREYVEQQIGEGKLKITTNEGVDASVDLIVSLTNSMRLSEDSTSSKVNQLVSFVSNLLKSDILKSETKNQIAEVISSNLGLEKDAVRDLMDTEIQSILDTGAVNTYVEAKLKSIFGGLRLQVFLIFLLGISIPLLEIILAHYLERKRKKEGMNRLEVDVDNRMNDRD